LAPIYEDPKYGPSFPDNDSRSHAFWEYDLRRRKRERLKKKKEHEMINPRRAAETQIYEDETAQPH
jgi:hypothetical protein